MGEVHDTHDPEYERQPDRDQRVDAAEKDRRERELRERVYLRASHAPSGIHLARLSVNSSGHTVTSSPPCHCSM